MLDILSFTYNTEQVGMFVWAKISDTYTSAEEFTDELLNNSGVFITPGSIFGNNGDLYVRLSLCADIEVLTAAKEIITRFSAMADAKDTHIIESEIVV
jgi:aspartate/methionine/tyrosine aminotransferase